MGEAYTHKHTYKDKRIPTHHKINFKSGKFVNKETNISLQLQRISLCISHVSEMSCTIQSLEEKTSYRGTYPNMLITPHSLSSFIMHEII